MYVQVIDDTKMHTLASASTVQKPVSEEVDYSSGPTIVSSFGTGHISVRTFVVVGLTRVFIYEVSWVFFCFFLNRFLNTMHTVS